MLKFFPNHLIYNLKLLTKANQYYNLSTMGKRFDSISDKHRTFINQQKMFFTGTAAADGRVNVSPKGMDSLRVLDGQTVVWLNLTGSGNETATHLLENDRMTLMFCAFDGPPTILRLYGHAQALRPDHKDWNKYVELFPKYRGIRQIILLTVDLVQKSCGYAVPEYQYIGNREVLTQWTAKKTEAELADYQKEKNSLSIDGKLTDISQE